MTDLKRTSLFDLHKELGGKMVAFAGWELSIQYPLGVMKEHLACREGAGLFDVSHMGQVILHTDAHALEALMPVDVEGLAPGRQRYALLTNAQGGIVDDLMLANRGEDYMVVANAANADTDIARFRDALGDAVSPVTDRALLALQGPRAEDILARILPDVRDMRFMDVATFQSDFGPLWLSRSGYTGDDGFEVSVGNDAAPALAKRLLSEGATPIGLGARNSLRMEAGLPLHGNEMDADTTPQTAGLGWAISKARRPGGAREGGFPGEAVILAEAETPPARTTTGLLPDGRAPMREGTPLFLPDTDTQVGHVTSGGFAPSLDRPISIIRVDRAHAAPGTTLHADLRGKRLPATTTALPFRQPTFKRQSNRTKT